VPTYRSITGPLAFAAFAAFVLPGSTAAQLATASAAVLGRGGSGVAVTRGFAAIAVNPAGLGMSGPGFSLALAPVQLRAGLGPIGLADLKEFEGVVVPASTKEQWLARVAADGGQSGPLAVEVTGLALSAGPVGLQISTVATARMNLAPDLVELALYGNAGRTGTPADLSMSGSSVDAFAVTTVGLAVGVPVSRGENAVSVGATLKYSVGHGLAVGRDDGGSVQGDPLRVEVRFPLITFDEEDESLEYGSGVGLDLGIQMQRGATSLGVSVQDVFHTFAWDTSRLVYRSGTAILDQDSQDTDFDARPFEGAPAALKDRVEELGFDPTVRVGAARAFGDDFTVAADLRKRLGDGMGLGHDFQLGGGAEFRGLGPLHLRGGAAVVTDGFELSAGVSLVLGPVNLTGAAAQFRGDAADASVGQFTLSFGGS